MKNQVKEVSEVEIIQGALSPQYWVQKSDPLAMIKDVPFSLSELKMMDTYISRINIADDSKRTVIFTKEQYEELMGISFANIKSLEKSTRGMLGKVATLRMPDEQYMQFVLFEQAQYYKDENGKPVVELTCSQTAKNLFFCLEKFHHFKYALENIIRLNKKSSYLLYSYLVRNRYKKHWSIELNELRDDVFSCKNEKSYQEYKIFKRAVLDPSAKEVNEKTDCQFEYTAVRYGRRIKSIEFTILDDNALPAPEIDPNQVSVFDALPVPMNEGLVEDHIDYYGSEELAILASGVQYEFTKEQMWELRTLLPDIDILPDKNFDGLDAIHWGRMNYLAQVYAKLNRVCEEKRNTKEPIKNRFAYFRAMVDKDRGDRE